MSTSLTSSTVQNYRQTCSRIMGNRLRSAKPQPQKENIGKDVERLSFKDIQNITRSLLKDRKAHEHNLGVLHNIKGKMYCLKLGEVSQFKEFSHFFYTSQYRRRVSIAERASSRIENELGIKKPQKRNTTEPSEFTQGNPHRKALLEAEDSESDIKMLEKIQNESPMKSMKIDGQLKQKVSRFLLPVEPLHQTLTAVKEPRRQRKRQSRGLTLHRVL